MKEVQKLSLVEINNHLALVDGWVHKNGTIQRDFNFKNYDETTAFVNDVIEIAQRHDHHPQISFGYKQCFVEYSTHSVSGISVKDFQCAKEINQLI